MCGIAGIANRAGPVSQQQLELMAARLDHRGPDDHGFHIRQHVGLVHTRLSIIDLSGGHQPLFARDQSLALVANGEIYNYIELRTELEQAGYTFATHSDCEVILHAYCEYGESFLDRIFGMFAFALFDGRTEQLILARDRLGIKPLFIAHNRQGLAFASEIKALLGFFEQLPDIDPDGLVQFLQNQFNNGQTTIFRNIERVLPGEAVMIQHGAIRKRWFYWQASAIKPVDCSYEDAAARFEPLIETVMRQHMRADVPFGLFLSGGLDSSVVLALLHRYRDEPVRTFSVGFPGTSVGSELEFAGQLARQYGSQHTVIKPSAEDMFHRLPHAVWAADDLMRDNANLPTSLLAESAARELKVVFTGEGSDEVFAGYGRYRKTPFELMLKNLFKPGSGGFRIRPNFGRHLQHTLFGRDLRAAADRARQPFIDAWQACRHDWSNIQRMQYTDIMTALADNLLVKVDRMLMAWGLEGRVPFLDHRIVEFGLALPDRLKIEHRQGKAFLRRWIAADLPGDHLQRKKKGFSVPVGEWLHGDYLHRLGRVLKQHPAIREWFVTAAIDDLIQQHRKKDASRHLLALLQFALWHEIFIENKGQKPPPLIDPLDLIDHYT